MLQLATRNTHPATRLYIIQIVAYIAARRGLRHRFFRRLNGLQAVRTGCVQHAADNCLIVFVNALSELFAVIYGGLRLPQIQQIDIRQPAVMNAGHQHFFPQNMQWLIRPAIAASACLPVLLFALGRLSAHANCDQCFSEI